LVLESNGEIICPREQNSWTTLAQRARLETSLKVAVWRSLKDMAYYYTKVKWIAGVITGLSWLKIVSLR
jgi:hypothetical protein